MDWEKEEKIADDARYKVILSDENRDVNSYDAIDRDQLVNLIRSLCEWELITSITKVTIIRG
jgi:hypothetical protein